MKRFLGLLLFTSVLSWTAWSAAQDPPPGKPDPPGQKQVEPPDGKGDAQRKADAEAKEQEKKAKELVSRIVKNMEQSGDRLGKKDPGDATRQIQGAILKDLDALIEQNQKQQDQQQKQQQQSSSSGGNSGNPSQGRPSQGNPSDSEPSQSKSGGQGEKQGQARNQGKGGNEPQGNARNEDKDPKGEPGRQGESKDPKDGQGMLLAKVKTGPGGKGILSEEFRNIWGHLPEFRRLEMDAYSRENFMRKYQDLLEQYYRTISEQNNR